MMIVVLLGILAASLAWGDCPPQATIERDLINTACSDSLISGPLVNLPISTLAELDEQLSLLYMPLADFTGAYDNLTLVESAQDVSKTVKLGYDLSGRSYQSWAYFNSLGSARAALVIPGTGTNQSTAIFNRDPANYHYDIVGILESQGWDTYVYIKPNEDCLAIHNGMGKLCDKCLVPRLLSAGGSYSARYLVDAIAWVKYLETLYARVVVIGLSQGGAAALLTALQSQPDGAFVASGWSVLSSGCSGLAQLILPGMDELLAPSSVLAGIQAQSTKYTFSWGRADNGAYEYDAKCGLTAGYLGKLRNVGCVSHDGGHEFCEEAIIDFLRQFTAPGPEGIALYQNVPNPFAESTLIRFSRAVSEETVLSIFDSLGRRVRTLSCVGNSAEWDGRDDEGNRVPAGVYTYSVGNTAMRMVLVR